MTQHTPTPWRVSLDKVSIVAHDKNPCDGLKPLLIPPPVKDGFFDEEEVPFSGQQEANATFIVRAVNNHDALIAVLERLCDDAAKYHGVVYEAGTFAEINRLLASVKGAA